MGSGTVADIDGDGELDVVSACQDNDRVVWHVNRGGQLGISGTSTEVSLSSNQADGVTDVAAADADGDGDVDLLICAKDGKKLVLIENLGAGQSWDAHVLVQDLAGCHMARFANITNGPTLDAVYAANGAGIGYVAELTTRTSVVGDSCCFGVDTRITTDTQGVHFAGPIDADGDGDVDLVVCSDEAPLHWWEQRAGRVWTRRELDDDAAFDFDWTDDHVTRGARMACAADVNGDGVIDLVVAYKYAREIAWLRGLGRSASDGVARFASRAVVANVSWPMALACGDVDGDARADVVVSAMSPECARASEVGCTRGVVLLQANRSATPRERWWLEPVEIGSPGACVDSVALARLDASSRAKAVVYWVRGRCKSSSVPDSSGVLTPPSEWWSWPPTPTPTTAPPTSTAAPTGVPTNAPSVAPSMSASPVPAPTPFPTALPTAAPTSTPIPAPTTLSIPAPTSTSYLVLMIGGIAVLPVIGIVLSVIGIRERGELKRKTPMLMQAQVDHHMK